MSLDMSKLQNLRAHGRKTTARCPACAELGGDNKGQHLLINPQGHFGCVVYAGNGADAKRHRRRIFELCGDRTIKPLVIRPATKIASLERSGSLFRNNSQHIAIKKGLLGRLGRGFSTHAQREEEIELNSGPLTQQNDVEMGVPAVPKSDVTLNRTLTERDLRVLKHAGAENDPIIVTALNLFNATVVE